MLAEQHHLGNKKQSLEMMEELIGMITKHLKKGERVKISELGILQVRKRAARMGRNPATGETNDKIVLDVVQSSRRKLWAKADLLRTSLENKKNPGFVCRGHLAFQMPRGRQFEYAPEKLSKSPAGVSAGLSLRSRCVRDRSIGWDGEIAAYANDRHRHIFDAKGLQYLPIQPGGFALTSLGGLNNQICDDLRYGRPQISKRFAGTVESLAHHRGRGVVEPNVLDRNDIHRSLPKSMSGSAEASLSHRGPKPFR